MKASRKTWASGRFSKRCLCRGEGGKPLCRGSSGKRKGVFYKACWCYQIFNKHLSFDYLNANEKWIKSSRVKTNKNYPWGSTRCSLSTSRDHLVTCSGASPDLAQQAAFQPELLPPSWVPRWGEAAIIPPPPPPPASIA